MSEVETVTVPEEDVDSTDVVDVEVVSDVVEEETPDETAPKAKRTRRSAQDVPAPAPVEEKSAFTRAKAQKQTEKMKASVETSAELFVEAYQGRIWLALDYQTWGDYLNGELGELRPRLPKVQRLELVGSMKKEAKMSQTAIAEALGVDQKTVSNDLREIKGQGGEVASASVGQDGVERDTSNIGRGRPRKNVVDRASTLFDKLDTLFGDLTELGAEDDWEENLGAIAARHRPDVARFIGQLRALQDAFNSAPEFEEEEAAPAE